MKTIQSFNTKLNRIIGLLLLIFIISSCGNTNKNDHQKKHLKTTVETEAHEHSVDKQAEATLYGCPMHKEMIGVKGDRCPLCNYNEMIPITWSLNGVDTVRVTSLPDYNPPSN